MFIFRIIMRVRSEKQKEVLQTLLSMIDLPIKDSGCLSYDIFNDISDNNMFNLISEWETRHQLDRYLRSDKMSILLGTKSLLSEPLTVQIIAVGDTEGVEAVYAVRKRN